MIKYSGREDPDSPCSRGHIPWGWMITIGLGAFRSRPFPLRTRDIGDNWWSQVTGCGAFKARRLEPDYVLYLSEVFEEVQVSRIISNVTVSCSGTTALLACSSFHGSDHEMVFPCRSVPFVPSLRLYACVGSFIQVHCVQTSVFAPSAPGTGYKYISMQN
jgi:hypothetical protein